MKTKTIGQLRSLFMDLYTIDQVNNDEELQSLYGLLTDKINLFGRDSLYIPQGEILHLLQTHAPSLLEL